MTTWLWIIGVTAVVWPVIIATYADWVNSKWINRVGAVSENKGHADVRERSLRVEISRLQTVIERQDALIAALWQKTFGFYRSELPEHLGVKPEWRPFQREWAGPVNYLVRYEPYPWGAHAENLYFPDRAA